MLTTIRNVLSILQKAMYSNGTTDGNFNIIRKKPEETNPINSNWQLPSLNSLSLSSTARKLGEIGVAMISGNDGDVKKEELIDVEGIRGAGIRKVTFDSIKKVKKI